jgi:hypothetical protein
MYFHIGVGAHTVCVAFHCEQSIADFKYELDIQVLIRSTPVNIDSTQICTKNPITAKSLLEAQYGRGNVLGTPVLVT